MNDNTIARSVINVGRYRFIGTCDGQYEVWVDGATTNALMPSLDAAMLYAIAWVNLGPRPLGVDMVARALKVKYE